MQDAGLLVNGTQLKVPQLLFTFTFCVKQLSVTFLPIIQCLVPTIQVCSNLHLVLKA